MRAHDATPRMVQRVRMHGALLHKTTPSSQMMHSSGQGMIVRDTPVAFRKPTQKKFGGRPDRATLPGHERYPAPSPSIQRLATPTRYNRQHRPDALTPWVPPGVNSGKKKKGAPLQTWAPRSGKKNGYENVNTTIDNRHSTKSSGDVFAIDGPQYKVGDRIGVTGFPSDATVRWIGKFPGNGFHMVGVAFDAPVGRNNGNNWGYKLYSCPINHGLLVRPDQVQFPLPQRVLYGVGDRVGVNGYCNGTVLYVGNFPQDSPNDQPVVGVELDQPIGRHAGNVDGVDYFKTDRLRGVLADPSLIRFPAQDDALPFVEPAVNYQVGDRVGIDGFPCNGTVRFIGSPPGSNEKVAGIELDEAVGSHNGTFMDVKYFACMEDHGVVCPEAQIIFPAPDHLEQQTDDDVWFEQHMINRRDTKTKQGFNFTYNISVNKDHLYTWPEFVQLEGHDMIPIKLVRLLYDHYVEESEQAHILQTHVALVQTVRQNNQDDVGVFSEKLEHEIDKAIGLRKIHHEELDLVANHLRFKGHVEDLQLHTGGAMEPQNSSTDEPSTRSPEKKQERDEHVRARTIEVEHANSLEHILARLHALNLDADEKAMLEATFKEDPGHAVETLNALESLSEHKQNAQAHRLNKLQSKWDTLQVERDNLSDRLTPDPNSSMDGSSRWSLNSATAPSPSGGGGGVKRVVNYPVQEEDGDLADHAVQEHRSDENTTYAAPLYL